MLLCWTAQEADRYTKTENALNRAGTKPKHAEKQLDKHRKQSAQQHTDDRREDIHLVPYLWKRTQGNSPLTTGPKNLTAVDNRFEPLGK